MKYVVKESEWYRGKGSNNSYLLKDSGLKCCLGFVGEQCGISKRKLRYSPTPRDTIIENKLFLSSNIITLIKDKWPKWFFDKNGFSRDDVNELMRINDHEWLSDHERKKKIREIFKKNGDTIVFIK